ncbi:MAG TPA: 50S ribosomal protein L6 [Geobacterales bacterium]|nr:50S ribosomal protein L6 [Geobacterales bacterium]
MSISETVVLNKEEIEIPENVEVNVSPDYFVEIKGKLGKIVKDLSPHRLKISKNKYRIYKDGNKVVVETMIKGKRGVALLYTLVSKIRAAIKGVNEGYTYKLKIIYSHFPVTVKVKGKEVYIENFIGERSPRKARIIGEYTKVEVKGEDIEVTGIDKDDVSQTAANIQQATKIKKRDPRKFLDGIYIYYRSK